MKSRLVVFLAGALLAATALADEKPTREIRRSPDGKFYVGWFDHDAGAPFGIVRPIVLRSATDSYDLFSFVSTPRSTDAAWNPSSSRCVIADAPDNAGPKTWLLLHHEPDPKTYEEWTKREIEPFSTLYAEFQKRDGEKSTLFRPSILKMEWLSDTKVRFRGYCNIGTYLITMDTDAPDKPPETEKLSDEWLEE